MSDKAACGRSFDESMLSGYLDGALTQGDAQRVQVHLEDCGACRGLLADLSRLRETARSTLFRPLPEDQWNETPRGELSRWARRLGLALLGVALVVALVLALWQPATTSGVWSRLFSASAIGGAACLLISALIDRLRVLPTDPYRGVKR